VIPPEGGCYGSKIITLPESQLDDPRTEQHAEKNENVINYGTWKDVVMTLWGYAVETESEPRPTEGVSRGPVPSPTRTHANQKRVLRENPSLWTEAEISRQLTRFQRPKTFCIVPYIGDNNL
jgi:hypothetical protein